MLIFCWPVEEQSKGANSISEPTVHVDTNDYRVVVPRLIGL